MSRLLFVACAVCLLVAASAAVRNDDTDFVAFQKFMLKYNKTYSTMHELNARFAIFQLSLDRVEGRKQAYFQKHGQVCPEALFGVTKFSDLTPAEFKSMYLGSVPPRQPASAPVVADDVMATPTSVDWRKKGAVTPVKDQQQCGSCWAFSATETIESQSFLNHGTLQVLSPQQITSCDTTDGGCGGGWPDTAYQYVQGAGGITTDKAYPYIDGDGNTYPCNLTSSMPLVVGVKNFSFAINPCYDTCASQNETALAAAVATKGPLSICVDAEPWQDYVSGVFNSDCANTYSDLDHCVQLVGYESTASTPYWIVRNSWNTDWGIEGYIWLGMGSNVCGVADHVTYPNAFAQN